MDMTPPNKVKLTPLRYNIDDDVTIDWQRWWKIVLSLSLLLELGLSYYWVNQVGFEAIQREISINIFLAVWGLIYLFLPDVASQKIFRDLAYVVYISFLVGVVVAVVFVVKFSPYQLYAVIFLLYSGLVGTLLSVVMLINLTVSRISETTQRHGQYIIMVPQASIYGQNELISKIMV